MKVQSAVSEKQAPAQKIAHFGSSRLREGFSAKQADTILKETDFKNLNLGIPGSTLRTWYYIIKMLDPDRDQFHSVVIHMPTVRDYEIYQDMNNRLEDLAFLAPSASLTDTWQIVWSFTDLNSRFQAFLSQLIKCYAYRFDLKDFLAHPLLRWQEINTKKKPFNPTDDYQGRPESLEGIRLNGKEIEGWPAEVFGKEMVEQYLDTSDVTEMGHGAEYVEYWSRKIANYYEGSSTRVIFLPIPVHPIHLPKQTVVQSVYNSFRESDHVIIVSEDMIHFLESPKYFFDGIHLNQQGRKLYTNLVSSLIRGHLVSSLPPDRRTHALSEFGNSTRISAHAF